MGAPAGVESPPTRSVLWAAAAVQRPNSAGPTYRRRPHNCQPAPPWLQYPRPDYYPEYNRGEKVGHLCRPESGTAVMFYTGKLPAQPETVLRIPRHNSPEKRMRPRTAIAAPSVKTPVPPVRVMDVTTKKKIWAEVDAEGLLVRHQQRPQTAPGGGRKQRGGEGRKDSVWLVDQTSAGAGAEKAISAGGNGGGGRCGAVKQIATMDAGAVKQIDAKVERAPGWCGYEVGKDELEVVGRKRLQPRPSTEQFAPIARDPPMQKLSKGAPGCFEHIEVGLKIKARYLKKFAEMANKPNANGGYTERKKHRDIRQKTIWRGPKEHSYVPPKKPPAVCNPRKGIHPEAGFSWHPLPTPAEVPTAKNRDHVYGTASLDFSALDRRRKADHFRLLIDPWRADLLGKPAIPPILN
mmetsp:Transcript_22628/g.57310  ORF Transcript_22628/g.57310 Transcript_22628/m.57310 type:complete len:407 (+) Transcript_22628:440-1660(+)